MRITGLRSNILMCMSSPSFAVLRNCYQAPDGRHCRDNSGTITYDEFKKVFQANIGPDAIPFDFECDWIKLYLGKKNGTHVLGCMFSPNYDTLLGLMSLLQTASLPSL